jgi:hypothetical protein
MENKGKTHWDIAEVGDVCHDECAVAQLRAARLQLTAEPAQEQASERDALLQQIDRLRRTIAYQARENSDKRPVDEIVHAVEVCYPAKATLPKDCPRCDAPAGEDVCREALSELVAAWGPVGAGGDAWAARFNAAMTTAGAILAGRANLATPQQEKK